jgi:hypothetical protein
MKIAHYETGLTHDQWHLLRRFLPAAKKRGRPRTALREVINAILYLVKTGAQWRQVNDRALVDGMRVLSAYQAANGTKFWIITEHDRRTTTVLLPEDY